MRRDSTIKKLLKIFLFIFSIYFYYKIFLKNILLCLDSQKKKKRRQVSAFLAIFKADFGRFRHVLAVSAVDRYDPIWPIWPVFGRISPVWCKSKPIQHESSRVGANRVKSARIREEKKKNADVDGRAGNRIERHIPRRTQVRHLWCRVRAF